MKDRMNYRGAYAPPIGSLGACRKEAEENVMTSRGSNHHPAYIVSLCLELKKSKSVCGAFWWKSKTEIECRDLSLLR